MRKIALLLALAAPLCAEDEASIQFLLARQDPGGAWTSRVPVRTTASALWALSLLDSSERNQGAAIRGFGYLERTIDTAGFWVQPGSSAAWLDQGLAAYACARWADRLPLASQLVVRARQGIIASQQKGGGWSETLGSVSKPERIPTAFMMRALYAGAPQEGGDKELVRSLAAAERHLGSFIDPMHGGLDRADATWVAISAWQAAGRGMDVQTRRAAVWAQGQMDEWNQPRPYRLLLATLAHESASGYQPWPGVVWRGLLAPEFERKRNETGGWPVAPREEDAGEIYATAMGLIHQHLLDHIQPIPFTITNPAPHLVYESGSSRWELIALMPIRPEDLLTRSPNIIAAIERAKSIWLMTDEDQCLFELAERIRSTDFPVRTTLVGLGRAPDLMRWSLSAHWSNSLRPLAYPPVHLLDPAALAQSIVDELKHLPASAVGQADASVSLRRIFERHLPTSTAPSDPDEDLILSGLPPDWGAAWRRHRSEMVSQLVHRILHDPPKSSGTVVLLPACYATGPGGVIDELSLRGQTGQQFRP